MVGMELWVFWEEVRPVLSGVYEKVKGMAQRKQGRLDKVLSLIPRYERKGL